MYDEDEDTFHHNGHEGHEGKDTPEQLPLCPLSPLWLINGGIDEPPIGDPIPKDPIHRAVAERHVPLVAVPRGLSQVGLAGRVGLVGFVFPTCPTYLTRLTCPT
jgi:hypothetical protein